MINEKVMDWMSRTVLTINADQTLPEAHALMKEYNVRRLPVLEQGRLVGIVTLGDLREASPSDATSLSIFELNYLLARLTMQDIMTRDPLTVAPNTRLAEAAKLMLHHKVGGLPVMEGGSLVGIITETDIFRAYVHLAEEPASEVAA
ncbi:MAG: CBS domain-containing protein [Anaerolineales bacterium]|nr:CBS domain-containing protein [Anaerolineales bacterium]MCW5854957.1 CBS domain-containing protein [Anaerolineales bacterium]